MSVQICLSYNIALCQMCTYFPSICRLSFGLGGGFFLLYISMLLNVFVLVFVASGTYVMLAEASMTLL